MKRSERLDIVQQAAARTDAGQLVAAEPNRAAQTVTQRVELFADVINLFNTEYETFGLLGEAEALARAFPCKK